MLHHYVPRSSIQNELWLQTRSIALRGDIDEDAVGEVIDYFRYFDRLSNQPIKLVLNSIGGDTVAGFSLVDVIKSLRSPVWTVVESCASMATLIAVVGESGHRYAFRSATIHLHDIWSSPEGKRHELEAEVGEIDRYSRAIYSLLLQHTDLPSFIRLKNPKSRSQTDLELLKVWLEGERYLSMREAKTAGIIDCVITKRTHRRLFGEKISGASS